MCHCVIILGIVAWQIRIKRFERIPFYYKCNVQSYFNAPDSYDSSTKFYSNRNSLWMLKDNYVILLVCIIYLLLNKARCGEAGRKNPWHHFLDAVPQITKIYEFFLRKFNEHKNYKKMTMNVEEKRMQWYYSLIRPIVPFFCKFVSIWNCHRVTI